MIRFWTATALALVGLALAGCAPKGPGVVSAPSGKATSFTIQSGGHYVLYHVTKLINNDHPDPNATQQVVSYDLRTGDVVGFEWQTDKAHEYDPDAHINLVAYAGTRRINLGGLHSPQEFYYWGEAK